MNAQLTASDKYIHAVRTSAESDALTAIEAGDGYCAYKMNTELMGRSPLQAHIYTRLMTELDEALDCQRQDNQMSRAVELVSTVPNPTPTYDVENKIPMHLYHIGMEDDESVQ